MKTFSSRLFNSCLLIISAFACSGPHSGSLPDVKPPIAKIIPFDIVSKNGDQRIDNYYWLNKREDTAVLSYLNAENRYYDTMMAHTRPLQDSLFNEIRSKIKEKDASVPVKRDNYYYYVRYQEGGDYPVYCRKKEKLDALE